MKKQDYIKNNNLTKICLLIAFVSLQLFNLNAQSEVYFNNYLATPTAPATQTSATGGFQTAVLSGWTGYDAVTYPGYYLTTGSAGTVTLNFATPISLTSCGANEGTVVVKWGCTSNRPLNLAVNGGANNAIDAVTISADRSVVRTATYTIPSGTTSISSLKLISSGGGGVYFFSIQVNTCVVVGPTLSVSPTTQSGFTYILGAGPSTAQSFVITGTSLTAGAAVTVASTTDYEYATVIGGPYSNTLSFPNAAGGAFSQTVYVRLKAGNPVGVYNAEVITIAGGGAAASQTVTASGSVTSGVLIPLTAPVVGAGSVPTATTFQANWSTSANATGGYIVNVYQGAALVKTVPIAGQASTSVSVTGLTASTAYTYKVIAVGDGLTYSNSPESAASASISTSTPPVSGSCEITLYESDFSDWLPLPAASSSSTARTVSGGAGDGFIITEDTEIVPSTPRFNLTTTSGRNIKYAPLKFSNGGTVYVRGNNTTGSSISGVDGATGVFDAATGTPVIIGNVKNMAYDLRFDLAAGVNGIQTLQWTSFRGYWSYMKVCTNPTGSPQMAVTNYMEAPGKGMSLTATLGGTAVSKVAIVKAWNVTCGVTMSIVGPNAALFNLPVTTLTQAEAIAGTNVVINFNPSVIAGVANAQLKLTSTCGAPDYYMDITGLTASGVAPEITTPSTTIPFWTSLIAPYTSTVNIAGVNLTGAVTLSITGPDAANFSIPVTTVLKTDALSGYSLPITYTGDIQSGAQTATLNISSPGATTVSIPLSGLTMDSRPVLYDLNFVVSPGGSGYVATNPGGTKFLSGTKVDVTATPETGYSLDHWGDGKASNYLTRTITVNDLNKGTITVFFTTGVVIPPPAPGSSFVGYEVDKTSPAYTTTSLPALWTPAIGATGYVVTVYNADGSVNPTAVVTMTGATSATISNLTTNTYYSYSVQTIGITPVKDTGKVGPFKTDGPDPVFTCPKVL